MSMENRDGVIWMDGKLVPWREANVHILTHSLHYGMGVFEGVRAYHTERGTAIFRLADHTDRLFRSAHVLNLGAEGMGLRADNLSVRVAIAAWEWGAYLGSENLQRGIRIRTSSYTRHHVNITMCKAKATGNYLNSTLALQEALSCGYDEALLLDNEGYVAEGSGENLFIVRNGELATPELTSVLEGITRDTVFTLAAELGLTIRERRITRDEVYVADEAFFTGTAAEVTPIREYDDRVIGNGARGPVTEELQRLYFDQVYGRRQQHPQWLTPVTDE